jgi:hypothetical protein
MYSHTQSRDNIKVGYKGIVYEDMDWNHQVQGKFLCLALVNLLLP